MSSHHPQPGHGQPTQLHPTQLHPTQLHPTQPYPLQPYPVQPPASEPAPGRKVAVPLWAIVAAGLVALCVVVAAIVTVVTLATGGSGEHEQAAGAPPPAGTGSASPGPATDQPEASDQPEDQDQPANPEGPPTLPVGEGAENSAGALTLTAAQRYTEPSSRYGEPPQNDVFLQVTIHAEAVGDEVYRVSASDFYVRDSGGRQYDYGGGHSLFEGGEHSLSVAELNSGEQITADLVFDVPDGAMELVFAPDYGRSQVIWQIP